MKLPPAKPAYSRSDEQTARTIMEQADNANLKRGVALPFVEMVDAVTNQTGKLTIQNGVITWTPA